MNPVPRQTLELLSPMNFRTMYDLGNKKTEGVPYSHFFRSQGIVYDSIDLNGMDGALPLDLNAKIDLPPRDLVSNIGTSEHVTNQQACFGNIHDLCLERMVHWVPLEKRHPTHGFYGYSVEFFLRIAEENDYMIEKLYIETSFQSWKLICCSLRKRHPVAAFRWRDDWSLNANLAGDDVHRVLANSLVPSA